MLPRLASGCILAVILVPPAARAQHSGQHAGGSSSAALTGSVAVAGNGASHVSGTQGVGGLAVGGVGWWSGYWLPYYAVGVPGGELVFVPPMPPYVPGGFGPIMRPGPVVFERGPVAPPPPPGWFPDVARRPAADKVDPPSRAKDTNRSAQLVIIGNRLFRGNNVKKAEERYLQATRFDPSSAAPLVGLAQVALVREQYAEAAARLREAETAQPGWMAKAPDIQAVYGEPGDFARRLSRLESHLQVHPDDRDAWLVLGAEWFLSGRTGRAADVFLRLNDPRRKPDIALSAFLHATNQE